MNRERLFNNGIKQLADWARAWVDNETMIDEAPDDALTDEEKAALLLLHMIEKMK